MGCCLKNASLWEELCLTAVRYMKSRSICTRAPGITLHCKYTGTSLRWASEALWGKIIATGKWEALLAMPFHGCWRLKFKVMGGKEEIGKSGICFLWSLPWPSSSDSNTSKIQCLMIQILWILLGWSQYKLHGRGGGEEELGFRPHVSLPKALKAA